MTSTESSENVCIVCFKNVLIYAIGECKCQKVNICYECSTRMRVLCHQNECPICRQDLPKVIFTSGVAPFRSINTSTYLMDKKYKICFENPEIQSAYNKLLEHACNQCTSRPAFRTFQNLKDHVRKEHDLQYCTLCVDNLKIFSGERRSYTRQELAQHRRKGDTDDRSHRGHPLCEFCDKRYMDNDELYRHLRRDHLFCHFCDADGFHHYYPSYDDLRHHFRTEHYLCEEGECEAGAGEYSVFRTEIDLKAHRASVHSRTLGKAGVKQARTLELEFTLAPRPKERADMARRGGPSARFQAAPPEDDMARFQEEFQQEPAGVPINTRSTDEFPTLGGAAPAPAGPSRRPNGVTIRAHGGKPPAVTDANFPALAPDALGPCKTVRLSVNSVRDRPGTGGKPPANVSIHVNRSAGAVRIQPSTSAAARNDFPSLSKHAPAPSNAQWTAQTKPRPPPPKPIQTFTVQQAFPGLKTAEEYPSLNARFSSACSLAARSDNLSSTSLAPRVETVSVTTHAAKVAPMPEVFRKKETKTAKATIAEVVKAKEVAAEGHKVKVKKKKPKGAEGKAAVKEAVVEVAKKKQKEIIEPEAYVARKKNVPDKITVPTESVAVKTAEESASRPATEPTAKLKAEVSAKVNGNATTTERKRSELNIASLAEPPPPASAYPPLAGCSGWPSPAEVVAPPPGFTSKAPPPGFSVTLNSVARPPSNGLTFTNSSGQNYPILPGPPARIFVQPQDFNARNTSLIAKVMGSLSTADISEFRQMSTMFRQGTLSAQTFLAHCRESMGGAFTGIMREMLVLLPDIGKQQELYAVFSRAERAGLEVCATCSQVLTMTDLRHHLLSHTLENHFPVLGGGASDPLPASHWGKK